MRIFLDTNIVIDFLTSRVAQSSDAERLFQLSNFNDIELVVTDLTIVNVVYVCKKVFPLQTIYEKISLLSDVITVIGIGSQAINSALELRSKDFEDAVQYFAARNYSCDYLVTRNQKDFVFSSIPVCSASQMLDLLTEG